MRLPCLRRGWSVLPDSKLIKTTPIRGRIVVSSARSGQLRLLPYLAIPSTVPVAKFRAAAVEGEVIRAPETSDKGGQAGVRAVSRAFLSALEGEASDPNADTCILVSADHKKHQLTCRIVWLQAHHRLYMNLAASMLHCMLPCIVQMRCD